MSSVRFCHSCKADTKYVCLICQGPECNRPECTVFLPEETPNEKPGPCVSACSDAVKQDVAEIAPQASNTQSGTAKPQKGVSQTSAAKATPIRKCLSLQQRVEVIRYAENHPNEGYRKLAEKFGVGRTQVQKILKEREAILAHYKSNVQTSKKRLRSAKYSDVNEALWEWYTLCRESNIPVDRKMLQEEALLIAEKLGISGFTASNGWLQRFKKHYNLQKMATSGEDGDVSKETLESWNECEREIAQEWRLEDVWNMDETGIFWRGLPDASLNKKGLQCTGGKQANQRNTWAFFVNAAGEKEDPIVIGKYAKPHCFNNLKDIKRPYGCWYYSNQKAWMNTEIMKEVLARLNEKLKREKRNILLLMDNAPCHPPSIADTFSNITIKFLLKNATSKTQPLDAGIITNWKIKYKMKLLRYVCSKVDSRKSASEIVKSINMSMAIEWGKQAWNEVLPDMIVKCFKKTKLHPQEVDEEEDPSEGKEELLALQGLLDKVSSSCDAETFISAEDSIDVCLGYIDHSNPNWRNDLREQILDDKDVMLSGPSEKRGRTNKMEDDDEFDPELKQPAIKTVPEAEELAEQLKDFAQFHGHEELSLVLSKVNDLLHAIKLQGPKSQTDITDFFSS